jgi:hypothetical protein
MGRLKTVNLPTELRIRLSEEMSNDLVKASVYTGMDFTNLTRMALIEFLNNHKDLLNVEIQERKLGMK